MTDTNTKLWRLIFSLFHLITTVLALIVVVGATVVYGTEPLGLLIPQDSLVTVLVGGSLTALVAFVSFLVVGVRKRTDGARGARIRWIVLDSLLMSGLAGGFLLAALMSINQASNISKSIKSKFSSFWQTASPTLITLIQSDGQCCGFDSYSDRVLEPCTKYSEAVGCWTVLRDEYGYYLHLFTPALLVLTCVCAASAFIALVLVILRIYGKHSKSDPSANGGFYYEQQEEPFRINRSEPFDAWHKAVFAA